MEARAPAEDPPLLAYRRLHKKWIMRTHTHQTAPTQFVYANDIRFAYRRFGKPNSVPLVFNQHFTGTMDHWDPAVTDGLSQWRRQREIGPRPCGSEFLVRRKPAVCAAPQRIGEKSAGR
jgi:hypothetical protein